MSAPRIQNTARFLRVTGIFNPIHDVPICICCLSQEGPFTTLITCAHAGFFVTIGSFVMKEDSVVCKLCHNILRKFALFREQAMENLIILQEYCQKPYQWPIKKIYNLKKRVISLINIHSTLPNCYKPEEIVNPVITGVRSLANEAALTREVVLIKEKQLANEAALNSEAVLNKEAQLAKEAALARESVLALAKETADNNYEDVEVKIEPDTIKQERGLDPLLIPNKTADVDKQLNEINTEPDLENDIPSYHVIGGNKIVLLGLGDNDKQQTEKLAENLESNTKPSYEVLPEEETYTFVMPKIVNAYGNVKANFNNVTPETVFSISNSTVESPMLMKFSLGPCNDSKNAKAAQNEIVGVPKEFISSLMMPLIKIAPKPGLNDTDDDTLKISNVVNAKEVRLPDPVKIDTGKLEPAFSGKITCIKLTKEEVQLERKKKKESNSYIKAPYKCESCVEPYYDEELYKVHKDLRHNWSSWVCKVCQISASSNAHLQQHHSKHYLRYKCDVCSELYIDKCDAVRHYKLAHGDIEETFSCNRCDFTTQIQLEMRRHKKGHQTKSCTFCKNRYMTESKLRLHMKNCNKDGKPMKTYSCDICKRVSKSFSNLKAHMENVHKGCSMNNMQNACPSYYCVDCKMFYKSKSNFDKHLLYSPKHGNNRFKKPEFQCDYCEQWFHTKEIIARHIYQKHITSENQCPTCEKNFTSLFQLKIHYGLMHKERSKDRPYICNHCAAAFVKKEILEAHLRIHSDERPFKCVNCPATFKLAASRYTHNRLVHKVRGGMKKAPKDVEMTPKEVGTTSKKVGKTSTEVRKTSKKVGKVLKKVKKTLDKVETTSEMVETAQDMVETAPVIVESIENVEMAPVIVESIEMTPVKVETLANVEMASTSKSLASSKRKRKAKN